MVRSLSLNWAHLGRWPLKAKRSPVGFEEQGGSNGSKFGSHLNCCRAKEFKFWMRLGPKKANFEFAMNHISQEFKFWISVVLRAKLLILWNFELKRSPNFRAFEMWIHHACQFGI